MDEHRNKSGSQGAEPKVSVVVAVLNGAQTIQRCIDSVTEQTYPNKELIAIDGGSTDGTVGTLKANAGKIAYWESEPDRGLAHAWNKALGRVAGDWIIFLGADDYLAKLTVLERMIPHLQSNDGAYLVYGRILLQGGDWDGMLLGSPYDWKRFRRRMAIPHPAAFHSRRLFDEVGEYDESKRVASDYELLLRLGEKNNPVFVDETVTVMFAGGSSMSYRKKALAESRDAQIKHKVAPAYLIHLWHLYFRGRVFEERLKKALSYRKEKR